MIDVLRRRLTYANVVSTLALVLAVGGGGFAVAAALKKNSVGPKQVKNESLKSQELKNEQAVKGEDVVDGSLAGGDVQDGSLAGGDVQDGSLAGGDVQDGSLGGGDVQDGSLGGADVQDGSLGGADIGDAAVGTAEIADGQVGAADLANDEPPHVIGAPGEPTLGNGGQGDCIWSDAITGIPFINPLSFYKDKLGRVHLTGIAFSENGSGGDAACDSSDPGERLEDNRIFTLPPGYRPANVEFLPARPGFPHVLWVGADTDTSTGAGTIPAGAVINVDVSGPTTAVLLDGLDFRAAGSGGFTARSVSYQRHRARGSAGVLGLFDP